MNIRGAFFAVASACLIGTATAQINVAGSANGGVATQINNWTAGSTADKANDGNRNGQWSVGSVSHTASQLNSWWRVDFANSELIDRIQIWNRVDGGSGITGRINPFSLFLRDAGNNVVWTSAGNTFVDNIDDANVDTAGMLFNVGGVMASSLEVRLDDTNYLHMGEVEAFNAVPEPATVVGLSLAALVAGRRRSKK